MSDYDRDYEHDRIAARRAHNRLIEDLDREIAEDALTVETDLGKVLDDEPPPLLFDMGPIYNSRRMEAAIQRQEDRITRLDERDRW